MMKILYITILSVLIASCSGGEKLGEVDGSSVTTNEFFDMLVDKYGFDRRRKIPLMYLKKQFKDYYTNEALIKEADKENFFDKPEVKKQIKIKKIMQLQSNMSSIVWVKEIKPRTITYSKRRIKKRDYRLFQNQVSAQFIFLSLQNKSEEVVKKLIKNIQTEFAKKIPFATLIAKYSDDKRNRGQLKNIDLSYSKIHALFKKALLFSGVPGFLVGPVYTEKGAYIGTVTKKHTRSLLSVKRDRKIRRYLRRTIRQNPCKRKDSKDISRAFMADLRRKYKDKVKTYPNRLNEYFVKLHQNLKIKSPIIYAEYQAYSRNFKAKRKHIELKFYLEKNYPFTLEVFNNSQKDVLFYSVEGGTQMSVAESVMKMQKVVYKYVGNIIKIKEDLRKRFIDHDLRYFVGVKKGYLKHPSIAKRDSFLSVEVKGQVYKKYLKEKYITKILNEVNDDAVKKYFDMKKNKFQNELPDSLTLIAMQTIKSKTTDNEKSILDKSYKKKGNIYKLRLRVNEKQLWLVLIKAGYKQYKDFAALKQKVKDTLLMDKYNKFDKLIIHPILKKYEIKFL